MTAADLIFRPASKAQRKARIFLSGPSGAGKTFSALGWAQVLGNNVGVIDTENDSALDYADVYRFLHLSLREPYTVDRYIAAIAAAAEAGVDPLIIDSASHAWAGKGGLLELVDRSRDSFGSGWRHATPKHQDFIEAMMAYPGHLIVCARAKQDYVIQNNPRTGKQEPVKLGMAPVQRDGLEYEFAIVGDLSIDHELRITKTRCGDLDGYTEERPGPRVAEILREWLSRGTPEVAVRRPKVEDLRAQATASGDVEVLRGLFEQAEQFHMLTVMVADGGGRMLPLGEYIRGRAVIAQQASRAPVPADRFYREPSAADEPAPSPTSSPASVPALQPAPAAPNGQAPDVMQLYADIDVEARRIRWNADMVKARFAAGVGHGMDEAVSPELQQFLAFLRKQDSPSAPAPGAVVSDAGIPAPAVNGQPQRQADARANRPTDPRADLMEEMLKLAGQLGWANPQQDLIRGFRDTMGVTHTEATTDQLHDYWGRLVQELASQPGGDPAPAATANGAGSSLPVAKPDRFAIVNQILKASREKRNLTPMAAKAAFTKATGSAWDKASDDELRGYLASLGGAVPVPA